MQTLLLKLHKAGEITENVYKNIRPTGSTRPLMYGVAKTHKPGVPLRPILAMIGSPQHATARWLSDLLKPVSDRYSRHVLKDSFEFAKTIREFTATKRVRMCSFDIKSLFTNVPLEETIQICAKELYHTDILPPPLSEKSSLTLIRKVTTGVEFSFDNIIYTDKQTAWPWVPC